MFLSYGTLAVDGSDCLCDARVQVVRVEANAVVKSLSIICPRLNRAPTKQSFNNEFCQLFT